MGQSADAEFTIKALTAETWEPYAGLIERHNGIFGGCWCSWFHRSVPGIQAVDGLGESYESNREIKRRLVEQGISRAAVVFDGDEAVAWCQFGTPLQLPAIHHRKQYLAETAQLPDYRVTCIFVDRRYRHRGLSAIALQGALELIAADGGGTVEGYPHDTGGQRQAVLYSGTRDMFERAGFNYVRPKGTKNTVMAKVVPPATT